MGRTVIDARIGRARHIHRQRSRRHFKPSELRNNRVVILERAVGKFVAKAILYLANASLRTVADALNAFTGDKSKRSILYGHFIFAERCAVKYLLGASRDERHFARRNRHRSLADEVIVVFRRHAIPDRVSTGILR